MRKRFLAVLATLAISVSVLSQTAWAGQKGAFFQVALLQSLMLGKYDGSITVAELKRHGDFGLGTFDKLNGEMIVLNGHVYQALCDGSVKEVQDSTTVPFASVAFFEAGSRAAMRNVKNLKQLKDLLDAEVNKAGSNYFYLVKIPVTAEKLCVRSVRAQKKPYRRLNKVMETDQVFFNHKNISGNVVAVYCPAYMSQLNAAGWHFHFISEDKKNGGHLLDIAFAKAEAVLCRINAFEMQLPDDKIFANMTLTEDLEKAIKQVETGQ